MNELREELIRQLSKIGVTKLNSLDFFEEERPNSFFPEGRTLFLEKGNYYIIGYERGRINSEKVFNNKEDILYHLLEQYVYRIAGKNVWEKVNGNFELYADLLPNEQIRLFNIIDPKYGAKRALEISEGE